MAAVLAINSNKPVQQVDIKKLQIILADNPLADGSTAEILVDNDDKKHTIIKGDWTTEKKGGYGPSLLMDDAKSGKVKLIQFIPEVKKSGAYIVYMYFPKLPNATSKTIITTFDGRKKKELTVAEKDIRVEGQTSGEWVSLGTMLLSKGKNGYIEISANGADGIVVADAVLFVPKTN